MRLLRKRLACRQAPNRASGRARPGRSTVSDSMSSPDFGTPSASDGALTPALGRAAFEFAAVKANRAGRRLDEANDHARQSRLAAAALAATARSISGEIEADAVETERFVQCRTGQAAFCHRRSQAEIFDGEQRALRLGGAVPARNSADANELASRVRALRPLRALSISCSRQNCSDSNARAHLHPYRRFVVAAVASMRAARRRSARGGNRARSGIIPHQFQRAILRPKSRLGRHSSRPAVYGCNWRRKTSRTGPCSTICPAYITPIRSLIRAMTPRLWLM